MYICDKMYMAFTQIFYISFLYLLLVVPTTTEKTKTKSGSKSDHIQYLGCMIDGTLLTSGGPEKVPNADEYLGSLRYYAGSSSKMTIQLCVAKCWKERFQYAALKGSKNCYCAVVLKGLSDLDNKTCNQACGGNNNQACGGQYSFSVYSTAYVKEPSFPVSATELEKDLVGCFSDGALKYFCLSRHSPFVSDRMSVQLCIVHCISLDFTNVYAATKGKDTCCCGDVELRNWQMDLKHPDRMCNGQCVTGGLPTCVGPNGLFKAYALGKLKTNKQLISMTAADLQKAKWLSPPFPEGETFEFAAKFSSNGTARNLANNEGAQVIDTLSEASPGTIVGICFGIGATVIIVLVVVHLRMRTMKMSDGGEADSTNQTGSEGDDTGPESQRKKRKSKSDDMMLAYMTALKGEKNDDGEKYLGEQNNSNSQIEISSFDDSEITDTTDRDSEDTGGERVEISNINGDNASFNNVYLKPHHLAYHKTLSQHRCNDVMVASQSEIHLQNQTNGCREEEVKQRDKADYIFQFSSFNMPRGKKFGRNMQRKGVVLTYFAPRTLPDVRGGSDEVKPLLS